MRSLPLSLLLLAATFLLGACTNDFRLNREIAGGVGSADMRVFEGARLILGDGEVIDGGILVVDGESITAVGPAASMTFPAEVQRIDVTGKTIIPALIDAHVHLGYEGFTSWRGENYTEDNVVDHLQRFAWYGFGTVFSTGTDPIDIALDVQRRQLAGEFGGADLLFAAGVAPPGQGPNPQMLESAAVLGRTIVRGVSTPAEGREAVRDIASDPIRFIKIWVDDRNGTQEKLRPAIYQAIIEEANARGIAVVAHQQDVEDMKELVRAGAAGFLHGRLGPAIDDEVVSMMAREDVFLVPNLGLGERGWTRDYDDPFLQVTLPEAAIQRLARDFRERPPRDPAREAELRAAFGKVLDGGVDILLGTDAGAVPDHFFGYSAHREMARFVELGMTPMQAILSATSAPARQLGLEDRGSLVAGSRADFVILNADPLEDIRNTEAISEVYLRGERVNRDSLAEHFRTVPSTATP